MRAYQLYLRGDASWDWIGTIDADTHADAFRAALLRLAPGDEQRPIRLEQDVEGAYRKPFEDARLGCHPGERPARIETAARK